MSTLATIPNAISPFGTPPSGVFADGASLRTSISRGVCCARTCDVLCGDGVFVATGCMAPVTTVTRGVAACAPLDVVGVLTGAPFGWDEGNGLNLQAVLVYYPAYLATKLVGERLRGAGEARKGVAAVRVLERNRSRR